MKRYPTIFVGLGLAVVASTATALPLQLVLESEQNLPGGEEVYLAQYDSAADLLAANHTAAAFSALNVSGNFSTTGFAYDGNQYQLLLESNENAIGGSELYIASFNSLAGFLTGTEAFAGFSQINISGNFSSTGLAHDGTQFHLLLESEDNEPGGSEVYLASYDSFADLLSGTEASAGFSALNVSGNFSTTGLAYDDNVFRLLLESHTNEPSGGEIYLASYASLADLLVGTEMSAGFSQLNVSGNFSTTGLSASAPSPFFGLDPSLLLPAFTEIDFNPGLGQIGTPERDPGRVAGTIDAGPDDGGRTFTSPAVEVAEPPSMVLLLAGLGLMLSLRRSRPKP